MDEAVEAAQEHVSTDPETFDYAERLVRGVAEDRKNIDQTIRELSKDWPLSRQPVVDRNILRLAVYEISSTEGTPAPVVVNEAVEIAKKYSTADSGKFVNGVLGAFLRTKDEDSTEPVTEEPEGESPSTEDEV